MNGFERIFMAGFFQPIYELNINWDSIFVFGFCPFPCSDQSIPAICGTTTCSNPYKNCIKQNVNSLNGLQQLVFNLLCHYEHHIKIITMFTVW